MTHDKDEKMRIARIRRPKRPGKAPKRDREDWIEIARKVLIADGIERVRIEPLAKRLGVTSGSFYHHFKNRGDLLESLLAHWERHNSGPMFAAVETAGPNPDKQIDALFNVWLIENEYNPAYDTAIRAWAHTAKAAEAAVRRVDDLRIDLLKRIFERFGYDERRAFVRARIAYFHQVGYQAMEVVESLHERRQLYDLYREALVGIPPKG